jgi:hypothetical protein
VTPLSIALHIGLNPIAEEISMTQHRHQTAPTQFVEAAGIRFAYRRFGKTGGVPLVFNMHFTGTMDHWDPVTDGFARDREVILQQNIPNAQLILYPDANHGSLYQYPELFVRHLSMFPEEQDRGACVPCWAIIAGDRLCPNRQMQ